MFHDAVAENRFAELQKQFGFKTVIETGTDYGHGALHASKYCDNVITMDISQESVDRSIKNWLDEGFEIVHQEGSNTILHRGNSQIVSFLGNSPDVMRQVLPATIGPHCFYLDAHGGGCPLLEELRVIADFGLSNSVIIIHDFKVPDRPSYGYNEYNGTPLCYDYIKADLARVNPNFKIGYNREVAPGANQRGIFYATP